MVTHLTIAPLPGDQIAKATEAVRAGGAGIDAMLPPLTEADVAQPQLLTLSDAAETWSVQPDPALPASDVPQRPLQLDVAPGEIRSARFSAQHNRLAVLRYAQGDPMMPTPGRDPVGNLLECYTFPEGKRERQVQLPALYELLHLSPDGNLALLGLHSSSPPTRDRLDVWAFEQDRHAAGWRPYGSQKEPQARQVQWARFVDRQHVLTISGSGVLVLWQLPECKAVYLLEDVDAAAALSAGAKYLAVNLREERTLRLLEAATGAWAGTLEEPPSLIGLKAAAFRPDGHRLAAVSGGGAMIWNLTDGRLLAQVPLPGVGGDQLRWCGADYLLLDNVLPGLPDWLLDLQRRFIVWSYRINLGCDVFGSPDDRYWYCAAAQRTPRGVGHSLIGIFMPSQQVSSRLGRVRLEDVALIHPGARVSVSASLPGADSKRLVEALTRKLEANGAIVQSGARVRVSVTGEEQGTGVTIAARGFGASFRDNEEFEQKQIKYTLRISDGSGRKYERSGTVSMRTFGMTDGRDAKKQLTDEMRQSAARTVEAISIPQYVFPEGTETGLGTSMLGPDGEAIAPTGDPDSR